MTKVEQYIQNLMTDNSKILATISIMLRCLENGINNFDMESLLETARDYAEHSENILGKLELKLHQ